MVEATNDLGVPMGLNPSEHSSARSRLASQKTPKIRKVNGYIIFYDDIIGQG